MTQEMIISTAEGVESSARAKQAPALENCDAAKTLIVSEGSRLCAAAAGHGARAIVLTGSMSRGEATLKKEGVSWRALGDATFLIVFDSPARLRTTELEREIEASLSVRGISCKIVVVTSTPAHLREMKPQIYAYELRERGIVLWGDNETLHLIPQFPAAEIPKEDGWWFLCNRMIEQLESAADANSLRAKDTAVRYRIAKLYLAMAACYLLSIGQYAPSYGERAARLQALAASDDPEPAPVPLQRFAKFVSQCTDLKLQGETFGASADFPQWSEAVSDAEVLWRWTLARLLGVSHSLSRRDLLTAMAARQSISARAKAWVRAAYVSPSASSRNWLRWGRLGWSMSPRYLVYAAASELFFAAPEPHAITANKLAEIVGGLPLLGRKADQPLSWGSVAKLIAHNFHLLLESTRC
jgi:hypothetical protein